VLNGKDTVAEDTRKAVFDALNELGYRRPPSAQPHSEGLVGVVMPELDNPIYPVYLQSIENALSRHGYGALMCSQQFAGASETAHIQMLLDYGVIAAIFVDGLHGDNTADKSEYIRLQKAGTALVLVNGYSPDIQASFISLDNNSAMDAAVGHLVSLNHKKIGLATGSPRFEETQRKKNAFLASMRKHGLEKAALAASSLSTVEGGQSAVSTLIAQGATAIICSSAQMTFGALLAAHAQDIQIPSQLSIIGFDDFTAAPFLNPPLTVIREPITPMGEACVSAFIDQLNTPDFTQDEILFQGSLIVRNSTALCR
jgi:DNA-binding LacI/PurR family transcriptional regulator